METGVDLRIPASHGLPAWCAPKDAGSVKELLARVHRKKQSTGYLGWVKGAGEGCRMTPDQRETASRHPALEDTIMQLVVSTLGKKPGSVKPDNPLLSSQAGFDSFSLMELVLRLEDTFGLSIPDEDLDPDVFHSVKAIASYVHMRLEQKD